jgi:hypothetical protein
MMQGKRRLVIGGICNRPIAHEPQRTRQPFTQQCSTLPPVVLVVHSMHGTQHLTDVRRRQERGPGATSSSDVTATTC